MASVGKCNKNVQRKKQEFIERMKKEVELLVSVVGMKISARS